MGAVRRPSNAVRACALARSRRHRVAQQAASAALWSVSWSVAFWRPFTPAQQLELTAVILRYIYLKPRNELLEWVRCQIIGFTPESDGVMLPPSCVDRGEAGRQSN